MKLEEIKFDREVIRPQVALPTFVQQESTDNKKKKSDKWSKTYKKGKLKKPKMVAVLFLRNNGKATPMEVETKNGFFEIERQVYHEDEDCIYNMNLDGKPYPLAIIPEWSLTPIGKKGWYARNDNENYLEFMIRKFAEFQNYTIKGIRHAELVRQGDRDSSKLNAKAVIGLIVLTIIGFVVFQNFF